MSTNWNKSAADDWSRQQPQSQADKDKEEKRQFKLLRGSYARREYKDDSDKVGSFVHYRAGTELDSPFLTRRECDKIGHAFLAPLQGGVIMPTQAQRDYLEKMAKVEQQKSQKGKDATAWPSV